MRSRLAQHPAQHSRSSAMLPFPLRAGAAGTAAAPPLRVRQIAAQRPRMYVARASAGAAGPLPSEVAAVEAFRAAAPGGAGLEPALKLLRQAAADKSVKPEVVEGALAYLEQEHARPASDVDGSWRLVFSTATSSRLMQYIPVQEDFVIQLAAQQCALESVVGPFSFAIRGHINAWQPASGAMDFQFTAVDIKLLGKQIWQVRPTTKPKTYTFFFSDDGIAAARSSAGGLALLRK